LTLYKSVGVAVQDAAVAALVLELGIPNIELVKLSTRGGLRRVAYGLYRFNDLPSTRFDQFYEAVARVGRDAHLTGDAVLVVRRGFSKGGSAASDFGDDVVGVLGPDERLGVVVPV
jgi:hypothetical protein